MLRIFLVIDDYNELIYLQSLLKKIGFDVEGLQNQKKYPDVSLGFNPQILITTAHGKKVDGIALARSIVKRRGIPKIIALHPPGHKVPKQEMEEAGVDIDLDSPINPKKLLTAIATLGVLDEVALLDKYAKIKSNVMASDEEAQQFVVHDDSGDIGHDIHKVKAALEEGSARFPIKSGEAPAQKVFGPEGSGDSPKYSSGDSPADLVKNASQAPNEILGKTLDVAPSLENSVIADEIGVDSVRRSRFEKWTKQMGDLPPSYFSRDRILDFNRKIREVPPVDDIKDIEADRKEFVKALFKNKK